MAGGKHDATPSWSGYIYQGKVAIFYALKVINEKIEENKNYDFAQYALEIEWMEDFAVWNGKKYESIHQVKAYKNSDPGKYKTAIEDLFEKLNEDSSSRGYLHIWKKIDFSDQIKTFESMRERYKKKDYSDEILERLELYNYSHQSCSETENCCGLREIDDKICQEIETYYEATGAQEDKRTVKQREGVKFKLFKILDVHITNRHQAIGDAGKKDTIPFTAILDAFTSNYEEASEEYIEIKLKNEIYNLLYDFCRNPKLCKNQKCDECSLKKVNEKLNGLSPTDVREILAKASPQTDTEKYELSALYSNKSGILSPWFNSFYSIDFDKIIFHPTEIKYKSNKPETMLPTTIIGDQLLEDTIAIDILENKKLATLPYLYDVDCMISSNITIDNVPKAAGNIRKFNIDDLLKENFFPNSRENEDVGKHIAKIRNLRISPLADVLGEFK